MSFWGVRWPNFVRMQTAWICSVLFVWFAVLAMAEECKVCPDLQDTFRSRILGFYNYNCNINETTYEAHVTCTRGFQQDGDEFNTTCICDAEGCEWEPEGSCQLEMLTLIIAVIAMIAIIVIFCLLMVLVWKRYTKRRKKSMYDTSLDVSEIIDGHHEAIGGVVGIGMTDLLPSPRIIPIEYPDEGDSHDVGSQTSERTETQAQVHLYANASAIEKMKTETGYDSGKGMILSNPQAGTSTENLLDTELDEPDGQTGYLDPYASIGDWPTKRARRGNSDASVGGSVKVRPVTAPPVFPDRSASFRMSGSYDDNGAEALYAKINKVKRASDRWPPGSKDSTRPHGRPADIGDLLNHISTPVSPTQPTTNSRGVADMYAEVNVDTRDGAVSTNTNPIPTAPKPNRNSSSSSGGSKIKHYAPPSQIQVGDHGDLYAQVDKSRPSTKTNIATVEFAPPSPPPLDGMDGLYAQMDRDRKSRKDPSLDVVDNDRDSPNSTDEGFVDHATTRV